MSRFLNIGRSGGRSYSQEIGKLEIGRKPISNPKSEISNWTRILPLEQFNLRFRI
jgi:hypothetical protein